MRLLLRASALLAALSLTLFSLASCKKDTDVVREYCEIEITLPKEFTEYEAAESFDAAYTDGRLIVGIQRLSFDAGVEDNVPATLTPLAFASYYLGRTGTEAEIFKHAYVPYATFTAPSGENEYDYLLSFYRTDYAYFIITFICVSPTTEHLKEEIFGYIDTVIYKTR